MQTPVVALFGQAEKGAYDTLYFCRKPIDLFTHLGHAPEDAYGLHFAMQTLCYGTPIMYYRVREEGVSLPDYSFGFRLLKQAHTAVITLKALFLPGVASLELIDEGAKLCQDRHSFLIMTESDFYDFITGRSAQH
ncbi:MAG: hypothetical protein LLF94_07200 [Chlamydiales bacterium]|nr:hypothetical protein [Chlamydiales bacterium]